MRGGRDEGEDGAADGGEAVRVGVLQRQVTEVLGSLKGRSIITQQSIVRGKYIGKTGHQIFRICEFLVIWLGKYFLQCPIPIYVRILVDIR